MELSLRLMKIAQIIEKCESMVDVGTDHAYIPIYLIDNKICNSAIASDINKGPIEKAKKNIAKEGLQNKIECRLGGGLSTISPNEVDVAVIAGMGGYLIKDIIEEHMDTFKSLDYVVLQPVQNSEIIREYIYTKGFKIIKEDLCRDENKFYEIIKIKYDNNPIELDRIYYEVSKNLVEEKHPVIKEFIEFKINRYENIRSSLKENTESTIERKEEVEYRLRRLEEMLQCL